MKAYAAYFTNNKIRIESSSGGLFSLIASKFDIVYGVEMDAKNETASFSRKTDDISSLRGSKYIQAKLGDTFQKVKKDLQDGEQVLFTGTACQVNGLSAFLQKDYSNLLLVDVICHGVPSSKFWKKYIAGKDIDVVNFRSKEMGWQNYGMKLNEKFISNSENMYMKLYLQNQCIRPSCFECVSKQAKKSDITIGDFWGIDEVAPELNDNNGTSIVIIRTEKGQIFFESLKEKLVWKEVSYEEGVRHNSSEYCSVNWPENREQFLRDMENMQFEAIYDKYVQQNTVIHKVKRKIKKLFDR